MDNNNNNIINEKTYLVTQRTDVKSLSHKKIIDDLQKLKELESRTLQKASITYDKTDSNITRAMKALSIINPFKGI